MTKTFAAGSSREEHAERNVQAVQNAVVHIPDEDGWPVVSGAGQEGYDGDMRDGAAEQEVLIPLRQHMFSGGNRRCTAEWRLTAEPCPPVQGQCGPILHNRMRARRMQEVAAHKAGASGMGGHLAEKDLVHCEAEFVTDAKGAQRPAAHVRLCAGDTAAGDDLCGQVECRASSIWRSM